VQEPLLPQRPTVGTSRRPAPQALPPRRGDDARLGPARYSCGSGMPSARAMAPTTRRTGLSPFTSAPRPPISVGAPWVLGMAAGEQFPRQSLVAGACMPHRRRCAVDRCRRPPGGDLVDGPVFRARHAGADQHRGRTERGIRLSARRTACERPQRSGEGSPRTARSAPGAVAGRAGPRCAERGDVPGLMLQARRNASVPHLLSPPQRLPRLRSTPSCACVGSGSPGAERSSRRRSRGWHGRPAANELRASFNSTSAPTI